MKVVRAFEDTPQPPQRTTFIGKIAGLPGSILAALAPRLERTRLAPDLDIEDSNGRDDYLWMVLAASDPDGVWFPWRTADRRSPDDDLHGNQTASLTPGRPPRTPRIVPPRR